MNCDALAEPLNALLDGELPPQEAVAVAAHLASCPACAKLFSELAQLRADLATLIPDQAAPEGLRSRIEAMLDAEANPPSNIIPFVQKPKPRRIKNLGWVAAAAAIAAMLVVTSLPRHDNTADLLSVRDAAIRSNLAFASNIGGSTVPGFQLTSYRNDEVAGHPAQVSQYTAHGQVFTLCVWPSYGEPAHGVRNASYKGMNITYWADGDQEFWAASTAPAAQLQAFAAALSAS